MILQESPPRLGRRLAMPHHVLGDRGFGDLNPQLEQLAMNPRSTPVRVIPAHDPNEVSHFWRHGWSPRFPAPDLPPPKEAEALPMPGNRCRWLHDQQGG